MAGMAGVHQVEKSRYGLVIEGFWLGDKYGIIAGNATFAPTTFPMICSGV
jgi:hypothetical protein